jgi:peptidoglycan/LPS O-acetylase OafA/YrhL
VKDADPRVASLDAFRVIAITCVMLAHGSLLGIDAFPSLRYVTIIFGVVGVELFFVLSGFLIGRQLLNVGEGTQSIKNFWARRWFRTLPNYYLFLGVNFALYLYVFKRPAGDASLLVFSHNLVAPFADAFFAESWSLAVEEWFYLLAPLLVFIFAAAFSGQRKFGVPNVLFAMLVVIVACTAARFWAAQWASASIDSALRKIVLLRLDALAFGVILAWLERYRPAVLAKLSRAWWLGVALLLIAISYLATLSESLAFFAPPDAQHRIFAPLLFTMLPIACALLLAGTQARPMRGRTWITNQSKWSYSMYLLHFPLLLLILHFFDGLKNPAIIALAFLAWYVATIIGAAAVYRWFEKPIMDLRKRFAPR